LRSADCKCVSSDAFSVFVESAFMIDMFDDLARCGGRPTEVWFLGRDSLLTERGQQVETELRCERERHQVEVVG